MDNNFINFLVKKHSLKAEEAAWFYYYFIEGKVQKDICSLLKINANQWRQYDALFKSNGMRGLYNNYWNRWKEMARRGQSENANLAESKAAFAEFIVKSNFRCCYCGVSHEFCQEHFTDLYDEFEKRGIDPYRIRGLVLDIEHISNYSNEKDNLTLACYVCNNAKSNFLTAKDFKEIARGINNFWKSKGAEETFPENSDIWKNNDYGLEK